MVRRILTETECPQQHQYRYNSVSPGCFVEADILRNIEELILDLDSEVNRVQNNAIFTLLEVGAPAIESLCHASGGDAYCKVSRYASMILGRMGERVNLKHQVVLCGEMSAQAKVAALNALSDIYYLDTDDQVPISGAHQYCTQLLRDSHPDVRAAASGLLEQIIPSENLLHQSMPRGDELLRSASREAPTLCAHELLRSGDIRDNAE